MIRHIATLSVSLALASVVAPQCEVVQIVSPTANEFELMYGVDASGALLVAGTPARTAAPGAAYAGAALLFSSTGSIWVETQELVGLDTAVNDWFGSVVAIDGNVVAATASGHRHVGATLTHYGAVYVFEPNGTQWAQTAELYAHDSGVPDGFAESVDVQGASIFVGAIYDDVATAGEGSVYLFDKGPTGWAFTQKLVASDPFPGAAFGAAIDVDGTRLVIGAPGANGASTGEGAVYVFEKSGATWGEVAKLSNPSGKFGDYFGGAVALDGDRLVAGAYREFVGCGPGLVCFDGSAYVYDRDPLSGAWLQSARLAASEGLYGAFFGVSVELEGDRALVGAYGATGIAPGTGAVYVFERDPTSSAWQEKYKLAASDGALGDSFASDLTLEGERLIVAAPYHDGVAADSGAAYEFALSPAGCPDLYGSPATVSVGAGGTQALTLNAGAGEAGRLYWLLGSISGIAPGFAFGALSVPLNPDAYLLATIVNPPTTPLVSSVGTLDATGAAGAAFALPPASDPALAGLGAHHAFVTLDPLSFAPRYASGPVRVDLVP